MGARDPAALHSLCHVHRVLGLVDLSYVDWLAFTSPMIKVFTLLVRIVMAVPLVVSVFTCFIGCAICTLDGLVVLLYSRRMACKEEPKLLHVYLNTTLSVESSCDNFRRTCFHTVCVFGHIEDGAPRIHQ